MERSWVHLGAIIEASLRDLFTTQRSHAFLPIACQIEIHEREAERLEQEAKRSEQLERGVRRLAIELDLQTQGINVPASRPFPTLPIEIEILIEAIWKLTSTINAGASELEATFDCFSDTLHLALASSHAFRQHLDQRSKCKRWKDRSTAQTLSHRPVGSHEWICAFERLYRSLLAIDSKSIGYQQGDYWAIPCNTN